MRICITGTPGVGKTTIAKELGRFFGFGVVNEKEFALREGIGGFNAETNELEVPLEKLEEKVNKRLGKGKDIIFEGHMLCEVKGDFDWVILLRLDPERLEYRLEHRGYHAEKVQDNVFCEGIDYCKKHAIRNYRSDTIIEVENNRTIKETVHAIVMQLHKKGV